MCLAWLLCAFLPTLIDGEEITKNPGTHVLTHVVKMIGGDKGSCCLVLNGYEESLAVTVTLQFGATNTTIMDKTITDSDHFSCHSFSVPKVEVTTSVFVILSISGKNVNTVERKACAIQKPQQLRMMQNNKPIYRPGDTVKAQMFFIDHNLQPLKKTLKYLFLKEPKGLRIAQWKDLVTEHGILELFYKLDNEASDGYYTIYSQEDVAKPEEFCGSFSVKEYVPQRIVLETSSPSTISVLDESFSVRVNVKYTFGKPAEGNVSVKCCRSPRSYYGPRRLCSDNNIVCHESTGEVDSNGTFIALFYMNQFHGRQEGYESYIRAEVTFVEVGTAILVPESRYIGITSELVNLNFDYDLMDQYYRSGLPCFIPMSMTDEKGKPIPDEEIQLSVNDKDVASLTTDSSGKAHYWLDTTDNHDPNINITITYRNNDHCYYMEYSNALYPTAQYRFQRFFTPFGSFVEIQRDGKELSCGKNHTFKARYLLCKECVRKNGKQSFYVQCLSSLNFIHHQKIVVDVSEACSGSFTFEIPVTAEYFQNADIIVTSIVRNNVIAHSINVNTEKCFKNEVSMSFSAEVVEPGSEVEVLVTAAPLSFCGIRSFDVALSSFQSYESLGPDTIFYNLYFLRQHGYNVDGTDFTEAAPPCRDPNKQIFCKDGYYVQVSPRTDGDSSQYFRALGVMVYATKSLLKPVVCGIPEIETFRPLFREGVVADSIAAKASPPPSGNAAPGTKETFRSNMAEEFGFKIIQIDSAGHASESVQVPDSITGWIGNALCISKHEGFGMTKYTANLTTFLQFFVDTSIPPSICRGEVLVVPTAVSNYNKAHYVTVKVTMQPSDDYQVTPGQDVEVERCIAPGEMSFFYYSVSFKTLGPTNLTCTAETTSIGTSCDGPSDPSVPQRKDTVVKKISVEADGVLYEDTKNFFICVKNSSETRHFTLSLPENVVQDSAKTSFGAMGDFLRMSYNNINNLLLLPQSCCEQTVARLRPLVHLLDYLRITGQLTDDMEKEAITYMNQGIQRLWNCRGFTGAYGTFYSTINSGNSWVTFIIYEALNELSEYVQIDESIQDQTLLWISTIQDQQTGCFKPQGYSLSLKARTNPVYALTMLANIAFHMRNRPLEVSMREKSMACVEEAHRNGNLDVYLKAMLLHTYTLSKQWGPWGPLYEDIMKQAVREGGTIYWLYADKWEAASGPGRSRSRNSAEVEMASRVLFCAMSHPNSSEYLTDGSQIALGIVEMFNSRGGAVSSPDTSMALQALSMYGRKTFVKDANHRVELLSDGEVIGIISLTPENRLLQQQIQLPQSTGNYDLAVTGTGCILAQVTTKCNIMVPKDDSAFSVTASTSSQSCKFGAAKSFTLNITASFNGDPNSCNMPVLEILCITGYSEDRIKLYELIRAGKIGRTEQIGGRLYLYFDGPIKEQVTLSILFTSDNTVMKIRQRTILMFCYYNKGQNGSTEYKHPCGDGE